jgi:hypothetical protein
MPLCGSCRRGVDNVILGRKRAITGKRILRFIGKKCDLCGRSY